MPCYHIYIDLPPFTPNVTTSIGMRVDVNSKRAYASLQEFIPNDITYNEKERVFCSARDTDELLTPEEKNKILDGFFGLRKNELVPILRFAIQDSNFVPLLTRTLTPLSTQQISDFMKPKTSIITERGGRNCIGNPCGDVEEEEEEVDEPEPEVEPDDPEEPGPPPNPPEKQPGKCYAAVIQIVWTDRQDPDNPVKTKKNLRFYVEENDPNDLPDLNVQEVPVDSAIWKSLFRDADADIEATVFTNNDGEINSIKVIKDWFEIECKEDPGLPGLDGVFDGGDDDDDDDEPPSKPAPQPPPKREEIKQIKIKFNIEKGCEDSEVYFSLPSSFNDIPFLLKDQTRKVLYDANRKVIKDFIRQKSLMFSRDKITELNPDPTTLFRGAYNKDYDVPSFIDAKNSADTNMVYLGIKYKAIWYLELNFKVSLVLLCDGQKFPSTKNIKIPIKDEMVALGVIEDRIQFTKLKNKYIHVFTSQNNTFKDNPYEVVLNNSVSNPKYFESKIFEYKNGKFNVKVASLEPIKKTLAQYITEQANKQKCPCCVESLKVEMINEDNDASAKCEILPL